MHYRRHRRRIMRNELLKVNEKVLRLQEQSARISQQYATQTQYLILTLESSHNCHLTSLHLPFHRVIEQWSDLVEEEWNLTRDALVKNAQSLIQCVSQNTLEWECSKAMLKEPHFPMMLGATPLYPGRWIIPAKKNGNVYVHGTTNPSKQHKALLLREFKTPWLKHVVAMPTHRPLTMSYDMFADPSMTRYLGSVVVSKMLANIKKRVCPVLSIESIVTLESNQGAGTLLFDFCKRLLFVDGTFDCGILFAQCLSSVPFWNVMDVTSTARALIFQMQFLYSTYEFEEDCVPRSKYIECDDDAPSPHKVPQKMRRGV
jgi:hypothetical protein